MTRTFEASAALHEVSQQLEPRLAALFWMELRPPHIAASDHRSDVAAGALQISSPLLRLGWAYTHRLRRQELRRCGVGPSGYHWMWSALYCLLLSVAILLCRTIPNQFISFLRVMK